jgi:outer membrane protein assembly factor BamB
VSSDGVFVSYPCQVYKFDPRTGTRLWFHDGGCEGGGGDTPVYSNGLVYVRDLGLSGPDQGEVFDAESGKQVHAFPGLASYTRAPAVSNQYAYFSSQTSGLMGTGSLDCRALGTLFLVWSFTGDGNIVSPPLVIDQTVFVGSSSGNVYALDGAAGTLLWTGNAGGKINGFDDYPGQPLAGFGAGDGYLVVPAANVLTAWKLTGP